MDKSKKAIEILRITNDGDDLTPHHLKLVEAAVNGALTEAGEQAFQSLYEQCIGPGYQKPWLHGIENLTIDNAGYVYWRDKIVEHYDLPFAHSQRSVPQAKQLAERCRTLENLGIEVNMYTTVWNWPASAGHDKDTCQQA